ncbi:unnamed protein product [Symbiodinium natans]|uniref:Uncharacterized protein n=1 Tax=Symbiodinium natans TaxID=878477 RepID=A0A812SWF3_9DINO|nr:unnamed protein product [Symbiodinium natans]
MLPWFWVCCTSKPLASPEDDTDDFLFRGDRPDSQIRSSTPICKHHRVLQASFGWCSLYSGVLATFETQGACFYSLSSPSFFPLFFGSPSLLPRWCRGPRLPLSALVLRSPGPLWSSCLWSRANLLSRDSGRQCTFRVFLQNPIQSHHYKHCIHCIRKWGGAGGAPTPRNYSYLLVLHSILFFVSASD